MTYSINAVTRRVVLSGSAGTGPYAFTFEILDDDDIQVYKDTTLLTKTTDYTVTINANGTGSVTLNTGTTNVPSAPTSSNTITVIGSRDIERTTDFVTAGDLKASSLNEQLDSLTIFDQQVAEEQKRSLQAPVFDPAHVDDGGTLDMTLPAKASRAGKYLSFNTDGNPIASAGTADATPISAALNTFVQSASIVAARTELLTGSNITMPNDAGSNSTIQSTGDIQLTPDATGKVFVTTDNAESFQAGNVKIEDNLISAANAQGELRLEPNGAGPLLINGTATVTEDTGTGTILSVHGTSTQGMIELVSEASGTVSSADVGKIQFNMSNNQATYKRCAEIAVTADGATNSRRGGNFIFRTRDNNATAMTEHMRLTRGGRLGIGTLAPGGPFHVESTVNEQVALFEASASTYTSNVIYVQTTKAASNTHKYFKANENDGAATSIQIIGNGNVQNANNSYGAISDQRIKQDITDASSQWDDIKALNFKNYKEKYRVSVDGDDAPVLLGLIAQDLESAGMNGLVETVEPDPYQKDTLGITDDVKAVKYSILYLKAVKALQEAIAKIEALEARVTTLENA